MVARPKSWDDEIAELGDLLLIDENALEDASREQAESFYRVSKWLAVLISERDEAKQQLAIVESEVDLEIRREVLDNNDKITEPEVKARCRVDKRVQAAQKEHNWFSKWVGQYDALKDSFVQRSYALNHLVDLHLASYFGEIKASQSKPRDVLRDAMADRARKGMAQARRD